MIEHAPQSPYLGFNDIEIYAFTLTHDNKYDWRVPTKDELRQDHSLVVIPENDVLALNIDGIMIKFTPVRDI